MSKEAASAHAQEPVRTVAPPARPAAPAFRALGAPAGTGPALSPAAVIALQRTAGNHAVSRLFSRASGAPAGVSALQRLAGDRAAASLLARGPLGAADSTDDMHAAVYGQSWLAHAPEPVQPRARAVQRVPARHGDQRTSPRASSASFHVQSLVSPPGRGSSGHTPRPRRPLDTEVPGFPHPQDLWHRLPSVLRPRNSGRFGLDVQATAGQNLAVWEAGGSLRGPSLQQGDTAVGVNVVAVSRDFRWREVRGRTNAMHALFEPSALFSVSYVPYGVDPAHVQAALVLAADLLHVRIGQWLDLHPVQAQVSAGADVPLGTPARFVVGGQAGMAAEFALPDNEGRGPSDRATISIGGAAQLQWVEGELSEALLVNVTLTAHLLRHDARP